MGRIRTIKPEFFKHEQLFDAEVETGLPLRVAFAGLWTQCDREGRFDWRPRALKTDILPYDDVDFSRVLDALSTRGFVVRYTCQGNEYGYIPTWHKHQVINNRESKSDIPGRAENKSELIDNTGEADASATRAARVEHALSTRHGLAQGEGKGRELEGKGKKDAVSDETGGEPPRISEVPAPDPETMEAQVYRLGKKVFGQSSGGMITKLYKHFDRDWLDVREALQIAATKGDPREYVAGILKPPEDPMDRVFAGAL